MCVCVCVCLSCGLVSCPPVGGCNLDCVIPGQQTGEDRHTAGTRTGSLLTQTHTRTHTGTSTHILTLTHTHAHSHTHTGQPATESPWVPQHASILLCWVLTHRDSHTWLTRDKLPITARKMEGNVSPQRKTANLKDTMPAERGYVTFSPTVWTLRQREAAPQILSPDRKSVV